MNRNSAVKSIVAAGLNGCSADFPILHQSVNGCPLVFLDSAASSQRPQSVIDAVTYYETHDHANVHRGVHTLSQRATDAYEGARRKVQNFLHAASDREIVFTRGTTEAINLVAHSFVEPQLNAGDEILITALEHHANIVPWQLVAERRGAKLVVTPVDDRGAVDIVAFAELLGPATRIAAFSHVSNALGSIQDVTTMTRLAHERGIPVLIDGAQGVPHGPVDVQAIGCDFYAFSAHKMYGPTGIGALYARQEILSDMPPWQGGGDMILEVDFEGTSFNDIPFRFEAGTPNISGTVGLGAAIDYLGSLGAENIASYEAELLAYATDALLGVDGLRIIGTAPHKASVISFALEEIHPHDIGTILDHQGIAIRTGHHCAMPLMKRFGVPGTARVSLGIYNSRADIDRLVEGLLLVRKMLV